MTVEAETPSISPEELAKLSLEQQPKKDEAEEKKDEGPDVIVDGPPLPADCTVNEKLMKAVVKEGGKRGVEIEGAADMGGLQFFCTSVDKPEGDITLLVETMKAMNARSDPSEEERKGGAGKIGKIILSCTDDNLCLVAYVPSDKSEQCNAMEWLKYVVRMVLDGDKNVEKYATISECAPVAAANYAKCVIKADKTNNIFPIKLRDPAITNAYSFLKSKGLFPDGDDDDDEDYVFGDEDFPE